MPTGGTLPTLPTLLTIQDLYLKFYTLPRRYLPYLAKRVDTYLPEVSYINKYLIRYSLSHAKGRIRIELGGRETLSTLPP